jgi:hypothetical protein
MGCALKMMEPVINPTVLRWGAAIKLEVQKFI